MPFRSLRGQGARISNGARSEPFSAVQPDFHLVANVSATAMLIKRPLPLQSEFTRNLPPANIVIAAEQEDETQVR
jgi:hypothetical protein